MKRERNESRGEEEKYENSFTYNMAMVAPFAAVRPLAAVWTVADFSLLLLVVASCGSSDGTGFGFLSGDTLAESFLISFPLFLAFFEYEDDLVAEAVAICFSIFASTLSAGTDFDFVSGEALAECFSTAVSSVLGSEVGLAVETAVICFSIFASTLTEGKVFDFISGDDLAASFLTSVSIVWTFPEDEDGLVAGAAAISFTVLVSTPSEWTGFSFISSGAFVESFLTTVSSILADEIDSAVETAEILFSIFASTLSEGNVFDFISGDGLAGSFLTTVSLILGDDAGSVVETAAISFPILFSTLSDFTETTCFFELDFALASVFSTASFFALFSLISFSLRVEVVAECSAENDSADREVNTFTSVPSIMTASVWVDLSLVVGTFRRVRFAS